MRRGTRNAIALAAIGVGLLSIAGCGQPVERDLSAVVYAQPGKDLADAMKARTKLTSIAEYLTNSPSFGTLRAQEEASVQANAAGAFDLTLGKTKSYAGQTYSFASSDYVTGGTFFPGGTVATQSTGTGYVSFQSYLRDTQSLFNGQEPPLSTDYHYLDAAEFEVLDGSRYDEGSVVYGVETPPQAYSTIPTGSATYNGTFRINAADASGPSGADAALTGTTTATVSFSTTPTADVTLNLTDVGTTPASGTLHGSGNLIDREGITLNPDTVFDALYPNSQAYLTGKVYGPAAEEFGGEISYLGQDTKGNDLVGHGYAVGKR